MFDRLMILSDGKTIYFDNAILAKQYFAKLEYVCPPLTNPADFLIELVSINPDEEQESKQRLQTLSTEYEKLQSNNEKV